MNDPRGSIWRKWDLHVHTPDSLVHHYGGAGADVWDKFIEALSKLPPEFKVLGINDYIFLDGYEKVLAAKAAGKLPNIELLLPVIELRLDKFGGSKSGLSRVNYHVIFSDTISADTIESQFLSALCPKYVLTPEMDALRKVGKWSGIPTRQSLEDLGKAIIESVPEPERVNYDTPLREGFNNLCVSLDAIGGILGSPYFEGKVLTAVGKTEWADIKWNDQSIADKKTIINSADLVFISSATAVEWTKAQKSLTDGGVNDRLLDCSDAHRYADSTDKDRLAKCFTWIKADPTFEGLRQAVFEYPSRVHVADVPPIAPFLQIKKATLKFPPKTSLSRGERSDVFCFSGTHEVVFSPYLTCIIGGRGTGKSTLLNLIHEKLDAGSTEFFRQNRLLPAGTSVATSVTIDGVTEKGVVEFLQQNEIEQFASDHKRLTAAIFARLGKLDTKNVLQEKEAAVDAAIAATQRQLDRLKSHHELSVKLSDSKKELATQKGIVESFQNTDYKRINDELRALNKELQGLKTSKSRLENLIQTLRTLLADYPAYDPSQMATLNAYEQQVRSVIEAIERSICAMDYGFAHYTVVLLGCTDGDGNLFVVDEHAERLWLPQRHAPAIKAMLARHKIGDRKLELGDLKRFVAGADVFSRQSDGTTVAAQYAKQGITLRPANTDRVNGWAEILSRFGEVSATPGDPANIRPTLFIHQRCGRLIETLPALQHDPNRPEDVLKVDADDDGSGGDDCADCLRYLVATKARAVAQRKLRGL